MLLLLRFFCSSKVAIRVVSRRRESDGSFNAASLFKVKKKFFVSNKEFEMKISVVSRIVWIGLLVCKSEFC